MSLHEEIGFESPYPIPLAKQTDLQLQSRLTHLIHVQEVLKDELNEAEGMAKYIGWILLERAKGNEQLVQA